MFRAVFWVFEGPKRSRVVRSWLTTRDSFRTSKRGSVLAKVVGLVMVDVQLQAVISGHVNPASALEFFSSRTQRHRSHGQ